MHTISSMVIDIVDTTSTPPSARTIAAILPSGRLNGTKKYVNC